jgi:hypothetical protein
MDQVMVPQEVAVAADPVAETAILHADLDTDME